MSAWPIERDAAYLARLAAAVEQAYGLVATAIVPAKRGFYAETWRLETADGRYFLKLMYPGPRQATYRASFAVMAGLAARGVDFIPGIRPTVDARLYAWFDGAVLGVFEWLDGDNVESDATKPAEFALLARLYSLDPAGLALPREDFGTAAASRFLARWRGLGDAVLTGWLEPYLGQFDRLADRLATCAERCQGDDSGFHLTHGDAGGNLIGRGGRYWLVDWDNPLLAPPERDAWVMAGQDWARAEFSAALRRVGLDYVLRPERLAYYCYHSFFFYLAEYLDSGRRDAAGLELLGYTNGWFEQRLRYADSL